MEQITQKMKYCKLENEQIPRIKLKLKEPNAGIRKVWSMYNQRTHFITKITRCKANKNGADNQSIN